jgi:Protein of unknown function (DUF2845)
MSERHVAVAVFSSMLVLGAPAVARADSLRCEGGLVSPGATTLDLLAKCGAPALREPQGQVVISTTSTPDGTQGRRVSSTVERWTYNFGPRQFLRHVTLQGGVVRAVASGTFGFDAAAPASAPQPGLLTLGTCEPLTELHLGASTFEVLKRCGEPVVRDVKLVETLVSTGVTGTTGGRELATQTWVSSSTIDVWSYNFGPQSFVRVLEFENGTLVRIREGGYGYEPRG